MGGGGVKGGGVSGPLAAPKRAPRAVSTGSEWDLMRERPGGGCRSPAEAKRGLACRARHSVRRW